MFYVGNKKVKEIVVKGSDSFLHRVRAGVFDNKYFYLTNPENSELVDVVVNYSGSRVNTVPQLVKKSKLSSTTININNVISDYDLMVSASSPGYDCVDSFSSSSRTLKLKSNTTKSTVTLNLIKASTMISTDSLALYINVEPLAIINNTSGAISLENACVYARDYQGQYQLSSVSDIHYTDDGYGGFIELFLSSPPETGVSDTVHFGFLSRDSAQHYGFNTHRDSSSSDYYGWGCWSDTEWLWSDAELYELFSINDSIRVSDNWQDAFSSFGTIGTVAHWGAYNLDTSVMSDWGTTCNVLQNDASFSHGWLVVTNSTAGTQQVEDISGTTFSDLYSAYIYPDLADGPTVTLILPASTGNGVADLYSELQTLGILQSQQDIVDSYFGTGGLNVDNVISGTYTFNVDVTSSDYSSYGYVYAGEFNVGVTECVSNSTGINLSSGLLYVGAYPPEATNLSVELNTSIDSTTLNGVMLGYKLLAFIANNSDSTSSDGTIVIN